MLIYWSRRQFDGDIYSLWTYDVNGMATNGNSRVYLLLGVASVLIICYGRGVLLLTHIVYLIVGIMEWLVKATGKWINNTELPRFLNGGRGE